jgi:hypothetical protein
MAVLSKNFASGCPRNDDPRLGRLRDPCFFRPVGLARNAALRSPQGEALRAKCRARPTTAAVVHREVWRPGGDPRLARAAIEPQAPRFLRAEGFSSPGEALCGLRTHAGLRALDLLSGRRLHSLSTRPGTISGLSLPLFVVLPHARFTMG